MSYGIDFLAQWRRAAFYVDRILRGAQPGDLPIEQPSRLELVIHAGTARKLGLVMPAALLTRAEEVIE